MSRYDWRRVAREYVDDAASYARLALDVCMRCGMCTAACTVYRATRDPRLSPLRRIEAAAKVLLGGQYGEDDLLSLYTCNLCGACTYTCPYGIEVLRLVHAARVKLLLEKGYVPESLAKVSRAARSSGHSFLLEPGEAVKVLKEAAREARVPVDEPGRFLYVPSPFETTVYPHVLTETLRALRSLGVEVSVSTRVLDAGGNAGIDANDIETGFSLLERAVEEAEKLGAEALLLPQCGTDEKLVVLAEKLGIHVGRGRVKGFYQLLAERGALLRCEECLLFTSCTFARLDPTRSLLAVTRAREPRDKPPYTMCCGGAGGLNYLHEEPYAGIRRRVYRWRFERLAREAHGKPIIVPCVKCYTVFKQGALLARNPLYPLRMYSSMLAVKVSGSESQP